MRFYKRVFPMAMLMLLAFGFVSSGFQESKRLGFAVAKDDDGSALAYSVNVGYDAFVGSHARKALTAQGYERVYTLPGSKFGHEINGGVYVVVKVDYKTYEGKNRTAFGMGAHENSTSIARERAESNLQTYSTWWKTYGGAVVVETKEF